MYKSAIIRPDIRKALALFVLVLFSRSLYSEADSIDFPGNWDRYPSHYQYIEFLNDLAGTYTDICRLDTIGYSVAGRPIMAMKITDNPDVREPEPAFYYSSTMHGDETSGFIHMLRLADHLCRNYGQDPLCTRLIDSIEIWINPLSNPDGTYRNNDSIISDPTRVNQNGTDLNRNFPSPTGGIVDHEPETLVQMEFMKNIHLVLSANIHDGEEVFNYPWDRWSRLHADDKWYIHAGRKYADTVQARAIPVLYMSGFDDGITNGYQWYSIDGGRQDYVNYFLHAREVTLELSNEKHPPGEDLPYLWHYNYPALLQYLENSLFGIQGKVSDTLDGRPLKALITIPDHDKDESFVYSDSTTGYFARLIEAGTWTLEFNAEGYEKKTIPGVMVEWDRAVYIDVQMKPIADGYDYFENIEVWPNPWTVETSIRFRVKVPGVRRIVLTGLDGRIVLQDQMSCSIPGTYTYELNGDGIESGWYILQFISPEGVFSVKLLRAK